VDERIVLDDAAVIAIVDKLIKQRKDSVAAFTQAGRQDLADKESAEITVLQAYLPARLSADEITREVAAIVAELGASGPGDMGKVMAPSRPAWPARPTWARSAARSRRPWPGKRARLPLLASGSSSARIFAVPGNQERSWHVKTTPAKPVLCVADVPP
jgi:uncharacterized protein YqeY